MRPLLLALAASLAAGGAAQAQTLPATQPDIAALELRMRIDMNRIEADLRAQEAAQFRFRSQLDQAQLQSSARNDLAERLSRVQPADIYAEVARGEQQRGRTDQRRKEEVDRRLKEIDR
jgi:hypothetical protein